MKQDWADSQVISLPKIKQREARVIAKIEPLKISLDAVFYQVAV